MVAWICTPSVKVLSKSLTTIKKNANHFGQNKETKSSLPFKQLLPQRQELSVLEQKEANIWH